VIATAGTAGEGTATAGTAGEGTATAGTAGEGRKQAPGGSREPFASELDCREM